VDYGDDGTVEFEQLVAEARWAKLRFELPPPHQAARSVRYILRKQGTGRAVLAHLRVGNSSSCPEARSRPDGASCTASDTCASGRCSDGTCVRCTAGRCGEGVQCGSDAECASGECLVGHCRSCGLTGTCPAFGDCTRDGQCASGLCQGADGPVLLTMEGVLWWGTSGQCAQCRQDSDCEGGAFCYHGVCAACRSDADCGVGERCLYEKAFEATERVCSARTVTPRARAALCEVDADCAGGLPCGASGDQAPRCGPACSVVAQDCPSPQAEVCATPSLVDPFGLKIDREIAEDRFPTCYPREALGIPDHGFTLQRGGSSSTTLMPR
jgi:hypothetical protein